MLEAHNFSLWAPACDPVNR